MQTKIGMTIIIKSIYKCNMTRGLQKIKEVSLIFSLINEHNNCYTGHVFEIDF